MTSRLPERRVLFVVEGDAETLMRASRALELAGIPVSSYGWELYDGHAAIHFVTPEPARARRVFEEMQVETTSRELVDRETPSDAPGARSAVPTVSRGVEEMGKALKRRR